MEEWAQMAVIGLSIFGTAVDGDTIRLQDNTYVRLEGMNTPERRSSCLTPEGKARERAKAAAATVRLQQLLEGKDATLVILKGSCAFGRRCGKLFSDGRDAKDVMIEEGRAEPLVCNGSGCPAPRDWCQ